MTAISKLFLTGFFITTLVTSPLVEHETENGSYVYSPASVDASSLLSGVEQAQAHFSRYFQDTPPAAAFVYYETEDQIPQYSENSLGMPVYSTNGGSGFKNIINWAGAGLHFYVSHEDQWVVFIIDPDSSAHRAGLQVNDIISPPNSIESRDTIDPNDFIGSFEENDVVELNVIREGAMLDLEMQLADTRVPVESSVMLAALETIPRVRPDIDFVSHEMVHTYVRKYIGRRTISAWFSEGFASLSESPESISENMNVLSDNQDDLLPWIHLFEMRHLTQQAQIAVSYAGQAGSSGTVVVSAGDNPGLFNSFKLFYPQSMSVLLYMSERYGDEEVGNLARWIADGQSASDFPLPDRDLGHETLIDHEADWSSWLLAQFEQE